MNTAGVNGPRLIAVGGGKGGVGKSIVAANLAVALAERRARVILVDADLGGANQHTLFGLDRPGLGLQGLLDHRVESLDEAAVETRVPGLRVVVGTGAVPNAANINHGQKQKLLRHVRALDADVVVIDVGAGISHNVVDFFDAAHVHLIVATPQLTSIQNAYAFLKAAVLRQFRHTAEAASQVQRLEAAISTRETERADEILAHLEDTDPLFAYTLRAELAKFDARLVGNQLSSQQELGVFQGVTRMVRDFLGVPLPLVGHIKASRLLHDSVNDRTPLLVSHPKDENAFAIRRIADRLLQDNLTVSGLAIPPPRMESDPAQDHELANFLRQSNRVVVGWSAGLDRNGDVSPVRVVDVSPGGIGIESHLRLRDGERCVLVLDEPTLALSIPMVVRHVDPGNHRAGLSFDASGDLPARVLQAARASTVARRAS